MWRKSVTAISIAGGKRNSSIDTVEKKGGIDIDNSKGKDSDMDNS